MQPSLRLATLALAIATAQAGAQPAAQERDAIVYRIRANTRLPQLAGERMGDLAPGGSMLLARVVAVGNHARIDPQGVNPTLRNSSVDDFILVIDSGHVVTVSPPSSSYREGSQISMGLSGMASALTRAAEDIADEIYGGFGAADPRDPPEPPVDRLPGEPDFPRGPEVQDAGVGLAVLNRFYIRSVTVDFDSLGAGEVIEGLATRRYTVRADFIARLRGGYFPVRMTIDVWTADVPGPIVNPFDPFGAGVYGTHGSPLQLTTQLAAVRRRFQGTPIKMITTTSLAMMGESIVRELSGKLTGEAPRMPPDTNLDIVQTITISGFQPTKVNFAELQLPAGFTKR